MLVLQFIPSVNAGDGGTTTYMQQLTAHLGTLCQLHVGVLTPVAECVPLSHCVVHSLTTSGATPGAIMHEWTCLLDALQPDIVHINCCWMPQMATITFAPTRWRRRSGSHLRIFLTPHGMLEPWIIKRNYWTRKLPAIWLYQRRVVRSCDVVVATAESERQHLLDLGWNRNVALVQNGIDVDSIVPKSEWHAPRELLFMSRLHPKKGLEMLFPVLPPGLHLTIAGTGEESYIQQLRQQVSALGLDDRVTFVGAVYGDDKWMLLRRADAVILPSYSENYGLIVAEALASATPVITTTGTPWQSLVEHHCGWWVNPDGRSLAAAMSELLKLSDADMKDYGKRARKLAEMDCTIIKKVRDLYHLYLSNC